MTYFLPLFAHIDLINNSTKYGKREELKTCRVFRKCSCIIFPEICLARIPFIIIINTLVLRLSLYIYWTLGFYPQFFPHSEHVICKYAYMFICVYMQIYISYTNQTVSMNLSSTQFDNFIKHTRIDTKIQHWCQCGFIKIKFHFYLSF